MGQSPCYFFPYQAWDPGTVYAKPINSVITLCVGDLLQNDRNQLFIQETGVVDIWLKGS